MRGSTTKMQSESFTFFTSITPITPTSTKLLLRMFTITLVNISFTVSQSFVTRVTSLPIGFSLKKPTCSFIMCAKMSLRRL